MRSILLLLALLAYGTDMQAQISNYYFVTEIGPVGRIESYGAPVTNHVIQDDVVTPGKIPMPFTFHLGTELVDSIGIAENGYLYLSSLNPFAVSSKWPLSAQHPSQVKGIISALGLDLAPVHSANQKTTVKSAVTGTPPFRMLIVEWRQASRASALNDAAGPDDINFQIRLYEATGRIEIAWDFFALNANVPVEDAEIGLRGNNFNDYHNRAITKDDWSTSVRGNSQTDRVPLGKQFKPAFGLLYVWERSPETQVPPVTPQSSLSVYPVPAFDRLYLNDAHKRGMGAYQIMDRAGRIMMSGTVAEGMLPVSPLPTGIYILKVRIGAGIESVLFEKN